MRKAENRDDGSSSIISQARASVGSVSLTQLVVWNIKKALEKEPALDLKTELKRTQATIESTEANVSTIISDSPERRHLSCALLAWQQLGHSSADSLFSFVEHRIEVEPNSQQWKSTSRTILYTPSPFIMSPRPGTIKCASFQRGSITHEDFYLSKSTSCYSTQPQLGRVLTLPQAPKVVMRLENTGKGAFCSICSNMKSKIEEACCLEKGCVERLGDLDRQVKELRSRLAKLAKREAERIELLQRAEGAWRDLEMGYMRRHRSCIEKEEDIARQMAKTLQKRNNCKEACQKLIKSVKPRSDAAEQAQDSLKQIEKAVCECACRRLSVMEKSAKEDAILADIQCKVAQQDRDLQFKEEQAIRKKQKVESSLESLRGLLYDTDRALKAELKGFKDQLKVVSKELFDEDAAIENKKVVRDDLLVEKAELKEDLEGCQNMCDKNMQKRVDELKEKKVKLEQLKNKVLECKCKYPVDVAVEAKRTPSLAAICSCSTMEREIDSCSCTSFRSRLLSDLFSDLFAGLQTELGNTSHNMPCQLLKCLEDNHNWDRPSVIKSNLRRFFATLLSGELDIAIASSIEKYHAKWIGVSCADYGRKIPDLDKTANMDWEDRALAQKAQWMASHMAKKMFEEKVEEIMKSTKDIVSKGPPPCTCKPPPNINDTAVFQCILESYDTRTQSFLPTIMPVPETESFVNDTESSMEIGVVGKNILSAQQKQIIKPSIQEPDISVLTTPNHKITRPLKSHIPKSISRPSNAQNRTPRANELNSTADMCWKRTQNDVILLRAQVANLKKASVKRNELKTLVNDLNQRAQQASGSGVQLKTHNIKTENHVKNTKITTKFSNRQIKKPWMKRPISKENSENDDIRGLKTKMKKQYAVNMCICDLHKVSKNKIVPTAHGAPNDYCIAKPTLNESQQILSNVSIKQSKPINQLPSDGENILNKEELLSLQTEKRNARGSTCVCLNKIPSCSSIDKFFDELKKWKHELSTLPGISSAPAQKPENKQIAQKASLNNYITSVVETHSNVEKSDISNPLQACSSIVETVGHEKNVSNVLSQKLDSAVDNNILCLKDSHPQVGDTIVATNIKNEPRKLTDKVLDETYKTSGIITNYNNEVPTTESVYMGAINLEKSNENIHEYLVNIDRRKDKDNLCYKEKNHHVVHKRSVVTSQKYTSPSKINTHKSFTQKKSYLHEDKQKTNGTLAKEISKKKETQTTNNQNSVDSVKNDMEKLYENSTHGDLKYGSQLHTLDIVKNMNRLESDQKLSDEQHGILSNDVQQKVSNDCDDIIRLIGVTLANLHSCDKSKKNQEERNNTSARHKKDLSHGEKSLLPPARRSLSFQPQLTRNIDSPNLTLNTAAKITRPLKTMQYNLDDSCECDAKLNEFKRIVDSYSLKINKDMAPDTKTFTLLNDNEIKKSLNSLNVLPNIDSLSNEHDVCVCCTNIGDESRDMEDNLFLLLMEYLKKRLDGVKGICQSSCINADNEKRVLSTLINKIKQTVADSTGKIACKCSQEEGSWQRAYELLQEYLKMKISRVECTCSSQDQDKVPTILSQLTSKVCQLIEKDFEQLKNICKCSKNAKSLVKQSNSKEEIRFQVPEKDRNDLLPITNFIVARSNISVQVIPDFQTASCDPVKINNLSIETQRSNIQNFIQKSCNTDCKILTKELNNQSTQYINTSLDLTDAVKSGSQMSCSLKEFLSEDKKCKENDAKNSCFLNPPLIGYTYDCSYSSHCNTFVCPKTKIQENAAAIQHLWKNVTKSNIASSNISYIMDNVHREKPKTINKVANTTLNLRDHNKEIILLKDSNQLMHVPVDVSTNTKQQNDEPFKYFRSDDNNIDADLKEIRHEKQPKLESKTEILESKLERLKAKSNKLDTEKENYQESTKKKFVHFPFPLHESKSEIITLTESNKPELPVCKCGMVPVCHVKMLVKDIEKKLIESKCICDSLSSTVCPVHSRNNLD